MSIMFLVGVLLLSGIEQMAWAEGNQAPSDANGIPRVVEQYREWELVKAAADAKDAATVMQQNEAAKLLEEACTAGEEGVNWAAWHTRVGAAVWEPFEFYARRDFYYSPSLMAKVSYVVTKDGEIKDVTLLEKSTDWSFDVLVCKCVRWASRRKTLLAFPEGTKKEAMFKVGVYTNESIRKREGPVYGRRFSFVQ